ncbi:PfkB family carbohydrate kinase [Ruania albidiflava]|uniref:PfkB family carbohydrate kinase n=1 Tax=Ruania albidiflava TaxID=366586 RepID=UPI0003B3BD85|nr:PfkB family carbohydrate kinase [Ruania albidiflava]
MSSTTGATWFVGLTTLDVVHRAQAPPSRNEKITATRQDVAAGGPAANAAVVAAALGARATLVSPLGSSAVAAAAHADLTGCGVHVVDVARDHELAVSAILVDATTGARSVTSLDGGAADPPAPDFAALPDPAVVLVDGHYPTLAVAAARAARARGAVVVLDAGRWRPVFAALIPLAHVVAASADFTLPDGGRGPGALVAAGAGVGVVTAGASPVQFVTGVGAGALTGAGEGPVTGAASGEVPVPAVPVRDTLGAGDAFHGALVAALAAGDPLRRALAVAVAVASHRVQHVGPRSYLHTAAAAVPG